MNKILKLINNKKYLLTCISFLLCLIIIFSSGYARYISIHEIAENALAIYLSKDTPGMHEFAHFQKVYHKTNFKNFQFTVELSGSYISGVYKKTIPFYAKIKIPLFSNKANIQKLTLNNHDYET